METFTLYKLSEVPRPVSIVPPPYCRRSPQSVEDGVVQQEKLPVLKLGVSNPSKLLMLCETLTDSSSKALEVKLNTYLMKESESATVFLLHLHAASQEAFVQTLGTEELETSMRFSLSSEVVSQIIYYEKKSLKWDDNINSEILAVFTNMFGDLKYRITAVPVARKQNFYPCSTQNLEPVFLTCFADSSKNEDFLIKLTQELFRYCLPVLLNTMSTEEETRKRLQYHSLLTVIRNLIFSLEDINGLIKTMTEEARKITNSKHCTLFLNNSNQMDLISRVFTTFSSSNIHTRIKLAQDHIIPDHVTTTGKLMNLQKGCEINLMDKSLAEYTGFETTNILCFPIRNENGITGAVQLCNKRNGNFNSFDEEIVNALSCFYGELITHTCKFLEGENFKIRNHLSDELMLYQIHVQETEVQRTLTCPLIHWYPNFDQFNFSPRTVVDTETVCFVMKMFQDLGFLESFTIEKRVLLRFVFFIKNGCRNVHYHNWKHLFCTAHFAYLCLKHLQLTENAYITQLEALAYFISCLCHDVDYRGITNPFEQEANNVLASLYSSYGSVMERYRLSQILRILNTEGCNFLEAFDKENYGLFLNLLKDLVLSVDLSTHFKYYNRQYKMIRQHYNKNNPEHRYMIVSLLVTCADLSDYIKDWSIVKNAALDLYTELLTEHKIKIPAGEQIPVTEMETFPLPDLQIEFLKQVCLPAFKLLGAIFGSLKELIHTLKKNILCWECSKHIFQKAILEGISCVEMLQSDEFDNKIEATIKLLETEN